VAVLRPVEKHEFSLPEREVEIQTKRGSGKGGQHRNVTDSCVVARHQPTGITVTIDGRDQHRNKALALKVLTAKLALQRDSISQNKRSKKRKHQVGTGQRGDKVRTYRVRDDRVVDHRSGQKWNLSAWLRGEW
jgi:peptide chain release factor 1